MGMGGNGIEKDIPAHLYSRAKIALLYSRQILETGKLSLKVFRRGRDEARMRQQETGNIAETVDDVSA